MHGCHKVTEVHATELYSLFLHFLIGSFFPLVILRVYLLSALCVGNWSLWEVRERGGTKDTGPPPSPAVEKNKSSQQEKAKMMVRISSI